MSTEPINTEVVEEQLPLGEEGDVKLFGGELIDNDTPPITPTDKEDKEDKVKEEVVDEPKETKEEDEEELEELSPIDGKPRPTFKEVTEKYPNLFKDFPALRHVFFREHEFTQIFGDVEDAKEAAEQAKDFKFFEEKVTTGDAKTFLTVVKDNGKENLQSFANSFLPALKEVDNDTFLQVTAPFIQSIFESAFRDGTNAGNDDLKYSACHLAKYIFGDPEFASGKKKVPEFKKEEKPVDKDRQELEDERKAYQTSRYTEARTDVNDDSIVSLKELIAEDLDPDNELTEFTSSHIIDDTFKEVDKLIAGDSDHMKKMNRLWLSAQRRGFDRSSKQQIVQAYINRAKDLIPEVRKRIRAKALGKRVTSVNKDEIENKRRDVVGGSRNGGSNNRRPVSADQVNWKKTSDEDLFSGKVTLRGN